MNRRARIRTGIMICLLRNRVEGRKENETGEEPADMRLPGHRLLGVGGTERDDCEQKIDAEPHQQESEHARIAQARSERSGGHAISFIAVAPQAERTATL